MRKLSLAAVLLATLTGCTPAAEPIAALAIEDGRPVGLLYVCRDTFSQFSVYERETPGDVFISWHVIGDATAGVAEIPLFGPLPEGWRDAGGPDSSAVGPSRDLTELRPDGHYGLSGDSHRNSLTITFTTADFDRIGPDQVLVPSGREETKVVSRGTFERKARASCE